MANDSKTAAKASEPMEVDEKDDDKNKKPTVPSKSVDAITVESRHIIATIEGHLYQIILFYKFADIRDHCRIIERAESAKEPRQILRVLRQLLFVRKLLNASVLYDCVQDLLPVAGAKHSGVSSRAFLLKYVKDKLPTKSVETGTAAVCYLFACRDDFMLAMCLNLVDGY